MHLTAMKGTSELKVMYTNIDGTVPSTDKTGVPNINKTNNIEISIEGRNNYDIWRNDRKGKKRCDDIDKVQDENNIYGA